MSKILLVDDDEELTSALDEWLTDEHHVVEVVSSGQEALERLRIYQYDVVILDWRLPQMSGVDVCRQYRSAGGTTPVIMLTGRSAIADKEQGLDAGADDYLTKPFHPKELSARLRALLRRPREVSQAVLKVGDLTLDPQTFTVSRADKQINLLKKEFALLEFFMRHPDQVFSNEAILDRVWPSDSDASPETVRVHVTRLRSKIDEDGKPSLITTVHRVGYKLVSKPS